MSVFLIEYQFTLRFDEFSFVVPFDAKDEDARIESAYPLMVANAAGQKETIGAILVRDRKQTVTGPPILRWAIVVHRLGPMVELPEGVGTLVGSFSSHQQRHQWHVFSPRKGSVVPTTLSLLDASPSRTASSPQEARVSPGTADTRSPASG